MLRVRALVGIASTLASTDPDRALEAARSITYDDWRARALAGIALLPA